MEDRSVDRLGIGVAQSVVYLQANALDGAALKSADAAGSMSQPLIAKRFFGFN